MAQKASDVIAKMKGVLGPDVAEKENIGEEDKIDFPMPDGFQLPTGIKPGDEFTSVGTFELKEDGDLCITKIEGIPISASEGPLPPSSGGTLGGMEVAKQSEITPY